MSLITMIDGQYALRHPLFLKMRDIFHNYYPVTLAHQLKDTCFLDSWFLVFLPKKWFPMENLSIVDKIVPIASMVAIACVSGISHGLQLALPFTWKERFGHPWGRRSSTVILFIIIFFLGSSHLAFYCAGKNPNWLHFIILIVGFGVLCFATSNNVRKFLNETKFSSSSPPKERAS